LQWSSDYENLQLILERDGVAMDASGTHSFFATEHGDCWTRGHGGPPPAPQVPNQNPRSKPVRKAGPLRRAPVEPIAVQSPNQNSKIKNPSALRKVTGR